MISFKLKVLYYKSLAWQYMNRQGAFPYKDYELITKFVKDRDIKSALELGTANGLTACCFLIKKDLHLITIEKNDKLVERATKNIQNFFKEDKNILDRVKVINERYFDYLDRYKLEDGKKFDCIFLDAYVTRLNEVQYLCEILNHDGLFIVSNLRPEIPKSRAAYDYIHNKEKFNVLLEKDDTIFAVKL